jgi:hypothetical protein
MAMAAPKKSAGKALSLFTQSVRKRANKRKQEVANSSGNRTRGGQVVRTPAQQKKYDNIIDGDFTDITPKTGFSKKALAALLTSGAIISLGQLNSMPPNKIKELTEKSDSDADASAKKPDGAAEAARLKAEADARNKKRKEQQAAVNATNPNIKPTKTGAKTGTKTGTTTTATTGKGKGKGKLFPKFRPFGGVIARALLGDDEKFGGERGMIDFIRTKKKKPASKEPVKKNMGGMMKKKGYAMGGMTKKGYANGGPAKKTTAKKTASRGKARGVGAAKRGYGKTMR